MPRPLRYLKVFELQALFEKAGGDQKQLSAIAVELETRKTSAAQRLRTQVAAARSGGSGVESTADHKISFGSGQPAKGGKPVPKCPLTIDLPIKVNHEIRARIRETFKEYQELVGPDDDRFVSEQFPRVANRLEKHDGYHQDLARTARALHDVYFTETDRNARVTNPARRYILVALFYLCDPHDIIPDYDPQSGYADDALVLNRCVSALRNRWRNIYDLTVKYSRKS